ncbi:MAG: TraI domain-containing protein [Gammaproteobacteria bacterium]
MFTTKVASSPAWDKVTSIMSKLPPHYPVLTPVQLLKGKNYPQTLSQIKNLAFVPETVFDDLYLKAIHEYAEFVQGLPATQVDHYNYHGGLLELGIKRALQTLAWYRREYPVRHPTPEQMPVRQAIWSYALFTAGLMYGIGQIVATYWVMMCEQNGHPTQRWNPVKGYMQDQGEFYRYSFETTRRDDMAARSTLVLALETLPQEGVSWIATDAEIFNAWLAILLNDEKHSGLFAKCILPLEAELEQQPNLEAGFLIGDLIQQYEIGEDKEEKKKLNLAQDKEDVPEKASFNEETEVPNSHFTKSVMVIQGKDITSAEISGSLGAPEFGEFFINWLRQFGQKYGRERGGVALSQLFITAPQGLLIGQDILKQFVEQNPKHGSVSDVYNKLKESPYVLAEVHKQATSGLTAQASTSQSNLNLALDPTTVSRKVLGSINHSLPLTVKNAPVYPASEQKQAPAPAKGPTSR